LVSAAAKASSADATIVAILERAISDDEPKKERKLAERKK